MQPLQLRQAASFQPGASVRHRPLLQRGRVSCSAPSADVLLEAPPAAAAPEPIFFSWEAQDGRPLTVALPFPEGEGPAPFTPPFVYPGEPEQRKEEAIVQEEQSTLVRRLWKGYVRALDEKPVLVKSATSFVGFLMGDLIAQSVTGTWNPYRTLRLVLFGMLLDGPIGHVWYTTLDKNVLPNEPTSNKAVVAKMLVDQLIWAPFFSCCFFLFTNTLAGHPDAVLPAIQEKLLPMMVANFAIWPLAHLINFKFVPSSQRILYINSVQIAWSAYLSNLSSSSSVPSHF